MLIVVLALCTNFLIWRARYLATIFTTPQAWAKRGVHMLDERYNRAGLRTSDLRREGASIFFLVILLSLLAGFFFHFIGRRIPFGWLIDVLILSSLINSRLVFEESNALLATLGRSQEEARATLMFYTGQNTYDMNESAIVSAGIENLALEFRRGLTSPVIFYLIFGLPGAVCIRIITIANRMVGLHTSHERKFGWLFTKAGKILTYLTAPIAAFLISLGAGRKIKSSLAWASKAAKLHPHSEEGWTEGAFSGALGISLRPERRYEGRRLRVPQIGRGKEMLKSQDLQRGINLYIRGHIVCAALLFIFYIGL
ncbi:MAG: cobalamin biosynthesis protein [Sphingomonadales bacterium]